MSRRVIGLYGGSGAGKSQAAAWFARQGALVIDADAVSREVSAANGSAYPALRTAFPDCFDSEGRLNRRALGDRVFADSAERSRLEQIVHPYMRQRIEQMMTEAAQDVIVLDCAILLHPTFRDLVDERWLITAPEAVRAARIESRDHLSAAQAAGRISAQSTDSELQKYADRIILNDGTPEELAERLAREYAESC